MDGSSSGLLFQGARDIPNELANRGARTDSFVHLESLGTPERDGFVPKRVTPIAASLHTILSIYRLNCRGSAA